MRQTKQPKKKEINKEKIIQLNNKQINKQNIDISIFQ